MNRRGFTIVELIIVITIMGILLVLGVVNVRGSQANARDEERRGDIEAISLSLESFYQSGTTGSTTFGRYPSTGLVGQETTILRDIDPKSLIAPGANSPVATFIKATNSAQTTSGVLPQPTISQYVYQPLQQNGTLCAAGEQMCQKFNLYYRTEIDNTVHMVTSKNQ